MAEFENATKALLDECRRGCSRGDAVHSRFVNAHAVFVAKVPDAQPSVPDLAEAPQQPDLPEMPQAPGGSVGQENALRSAERYLEIQGFSRAGLIEQLSSEYGDGYSVADATWAVDHVGADWDEQAVRAARRYLEIQGFSRAGLIEQLSSPHGDRFTKQQATHAADAVGL